MTKPFYVPDPYIIPPKDQVADASKVMNSPEKPDSCEHILDMEKMVDVMSSNNSNGWISVKERLPEEGLEVLIFGKVLRDISKILGVRARFNGDQEWKYTWESEGIHIYTQDDVTHWMPLPKPPEEK